MNEVTIIKQPVEVSEKQASAWLQLAKGKNQLTNDLAKMELAAQSILLIETKKYEIIDEALAAYRKAHTDMVEVRKTFTNAVTAGIVEPLMQFEKRVDPKVNETYNTLSQISLQLRKKEKEDAEKINKKNQERTRFKTFVENEFHRVCAEYRGLLRKESLGQYKFALDAKLHPGTDDIKKMMTTLDIPVINKFTGTLSHEEMMEIYGTIPKPDYKCIYDDAMIELDNIFSNFESDIANADAAMHHHNDQLQLTLIDEAKELAETVAINTLIATAETVQIEAPKIKRTLIVEVEESWEWAFATMSAFILNKNHLFKYIKVKSISKLSTGQMAEYLGKYATETGCTFNGLKLKEVEK